MARATLSAVPPLGILVVFVVAVCALVWSARRARELFVLSARGGKVIVVRGHLPPGLFEALSDVLERSGPRAATVRVHKTEHHARLTASGLDDVTLQRARNVLGTFPLQRLVSADWPRTKNLGQRLGIAWLAWRLR